MADPLLLSRDSTSFALDYGWFQIFGAREVLDNLTLIEMAYASPPSASDGSSVLVLSPRQFSPAVPIEVEVWDSAPPNDRGSWQQVSAHPVTIDERGELYIESPTLEGVWVTVRSGEQTLEISGRGFDTDSQPGSGEPDDHWRIRLWPSSAQLLDPPQHVATSSASGGLPAAPSTGGIAIGEVAAQRDSPGSIYVHPDERTEMERQIDRTTPQGDTEAPVVAEPEATTTPAARIARLVAATRADSGTSIPMRLSDLRSAAFGAGRGPMSVRRDDKLVEHSTAAEMADGVEMDAADRTEQNAALDVEGEFLTGAREEGRITGSLSRPGNVSNEVRELSMQALRNRGNVKRSDPPAPA